MHFTLWMFKGWKIVFSPYYKVVWTWATVSYVQNATYLLHILPLNMAAIRIIVVLPRVVWADSFPFKTSTLGLQKALCFRPWPNLCLFSPSGPENPSVFSVKLCSFNRSYDSLLGVTAQMLTFRNDFWTVSEQNLAQSG